MPMDRHGASAFAATAALGAWKRELGPARRHFSAL